MAAEVRSPCSTIGLRASIAISCIVFTVGSGCDIRMYLQASVAWLSLSAIASAAFLFSDCCAVSFTRRVRSISQSRLGQSQLCKSGCGLGVIAANDLQRWLPFIEIAPMLHYSSSKADIGPVAGEWRKQLDPLFGIELIDGFRSLS